MSNNKVWILVGPCSIQGPKVVKKKISKKEKVKIALLSPANACVTNSSFLMSSQQCSTVNSPISVALLSRGLKRDKLFQVHHYLLQRDSHKYVIGSFWIKSNK